MRSQEHNPFDTLNRRFPWAEDTNTLFKKYQPEQVNKIIYAYFIRALVSIDRLVPHALSEQMVLTTIISLHKRVITMIVSTNHYQLLKNFPQYLVEKELINPEFYNEFTLNQRDIPNYINQNSPYLFIVQNTFEGQNPLFVTQDAFLLLPIFMPLLAKEQPLLLLTQIAEIASRISDHTWYQNKDLSKVTDRAHSFVAEVTSAYQKKYQANIPAFLETIIDNYPQGFASSQNWYRVGNPNVLMFGEDIVYKQR